MNKGIFVVLPVLLLTCLNAWSKTIEDEKDQAMEKHWHFFDPVEDSIAGIGLFKAYELLQDRPSTEVVVAIIDTGVDKEHEDLDDNIWLNADEVPDNGIDDDNNGYVDDINGWNFNGGPEINVTFDNLEVTREYARLKGKYGNSKNGKGRKYDYWMTVKTEYQRDSAKYYYQQMRYENLKKSFNNQYSKVESFLEDESISISKLNDIDAEDSQVEQAIDSLKSILAGFEKMNGTPDENGKTNAYHPDDFIAWVDEVLDYLGMYTDYFYNQNFDPRGAVQDDCSNVNERIYGNNEAWNFSGKYGYHGTHVAGIVGAERNNDIGMDGIVQNVKIMSLRACSTGDERDKDIANSIRYAADNGAQVINMSFGKFFSPNSKAVHKAIKRAEKKGVIMVHGAGNENTNVDMRAVYPNPHYSKRKKAGTWINVGANYKNQDADLPASFSNFGKINVDVFAPGVNIYSTMPEDQYKPASGTSMASPVVAGVAALLRSYFPELSAEQVRDIILESSYKPEDLMVIKPGTDTEIDFRDLSKSGGIVNAYRAVQMALKLTGTN